VGNYTSVRVHKKVKKKIDKIAKGLDLSVVKTIEVLCEKSLQEPLKIRLKWTPDIYNMSCDDFPEISRAFVDIKKKSENHNSKYDTIYNIKKIRDEDQKHPIECWKQAYLQMMIESIERKIATFYAFKVSRLIIYAHKWHEKQETVYLAFTYVPKSSKIIGLKKHKCAECKEEFETMGTIGDPNGYTRTWTWNKMRFCSKECQWKKFQRHRRKKKLIKLTNKVRNNEIKEFLHLPEENQ